MKMLWFFPVAIAIGLAGTQTALRHRHAPRTRRRDRSWVLILGMAWLPLVCWILSLVVTQEP